MLFFQAFAIVNSTLVMGSAVIYCTDSNNLFDRDVFQIHYNSLKLVQGRGGVRIKVCATVFFYGCILVIICCDENETNCKGFSTSEAISVVG